MKQLRTLACIAAVGLSVSGMMSPATAAENWPMFGKNYDNSRATSDTQISTSNVSTLNVVRRTTDGGITGTPTVVDGVAYYSDFSGYVKAVRVSDGVVLWRVRPQTTMLSPSPFVTSDTVYVAGNNSYVYALDRANGAVRWTTRIETSPNSRISSSPIVVGNTLIIGTGSYQVFIPATPMFRGRVAFLNATTGAILPYSTNMCPSASCGGGISVWSTAAIDVSTRTGYIGTGQAYRDPAGPYSDSLVAFNIDTGAIRWAQQFRSNDVYQLGGVLRYDYDVGAAPNLFVANGRRMVGVGGKDGTYRAFDRDTGAAIWNTPVGRASAIGGVMQSTAYGDGRIYVTSNTSTIGGGRNDPVPATAEAAALDAATGTPIWIRQLDAGGFGGIAYANGLMYASAWDGRLRVFNAANGNIVREVQASPARGAYVPAPTDGFPNGSASGPVVYGNRVLMGYGWTWVLNINGGLTTMEANVGGGGGSGETITIASSSDTYVQSGTPTTNYAYDVNLLARLADAEGLTRASFLQFPLNSIPAGTILSARLRVYGRHDATSGTGQSVSVWPGTKTTTWSGANVTYNNSSTETGVDFYASSPIATTTVGITPQYYEWNVTDYVNSRRTLGHATFGLAVDSANQYRVTLNSADNAASRPELVIIMAGNGRGGSGRTRPLASASDTNRQSGSTATNYAYDVNLLARLADAEGLTRASFLQFPLNSIPAGNITSARLRLYGRHDATSGTGQSVSVWPGTKTTTWSGANVTYNNSSTETGVDFYATSSIATTTVGITPQYYEWNVTDYVNSRRTLGHATFGVAVDSANQYRVTFNSADNTANRPELLVTVNGGSGGNNQLPGSCPSGFTARAGVNQGFMHNGVARAFVLNVPSNVSTPRPVFVSLTGSVESTNENLGARGGMGALSSNGFLIIGPVRRCAGQDPNGSGTSVNGGTCNQAGTGGWNWNPWNEGRVFAAAGDPWKTAEGPDSQFLEAVVRCVAASFPVDSKRMYLGGISSGGTMTNRALLFNSDFWAGGLPLSGEWYVTQDNGTAYPGADEFAARRQAVINNPTKIFQGRVGPLPLRTTLDPMIVITVWGGANDIWYCGSTLCSDYRPSTQVGSNYFSAQSNVVHVACSSTHGHQWPTVNRAAFNVWAATTLASHPKGTPASAFVLPPPPSGYTCRVGRYTDHY